MFICVESGIKQGEQLPVSYTHLVVADEDVVKVHVHTNHPGLAFEKALTYGSLSRMKVDNMREEHEAVSYTHLMPVIRF